MIDESVLTSLLHETADAIEVPEGGPAAVLAARQAMGSGPVLGFPVVSGRVGRRRRGLGGRGPGAGPRWSPEARAWAVRVAAVVLVFVLVGVGIATRGNSSSKSSSSAETTVAPFSSTTIAGSAGLPSSARSSSGDGAGSGGSTTGASATTVPSSAVAPLPTLVIRTGSLALVVATGAVQSTTVKLTSLATGLGGYVQSSDSSSTDSPTASMTLRVPVAYFNQLVADAEGLGKVTSLTTSGQDVTAQSVDLAAQIQALQASINQYLEILTKAETISDILAVQQQIDGLQSQLNQLQGQQKVLNDQTSYSTLSVTLSQPAAPAKVPPPPPPPPHRSGLSKAWAHARRSFSHGLESVVSASGGILVFLICVGAIGLVGWAGWRVARRRLV
jgi:hypothetical protein